MYISLDRESLFSVFPPPDPVAVQLNTYGGLIVLDEDADNLKSVQKGKRGRPPVIDWNAVHVELAKKASNGNLPDKQEACIAEMQQWCMDQWGLSPERSSLQTRISPYYKAFKKK